MDIPFSNLVERKVPFSSVIERSGTHQRIHESKKFNVCIFFFLKDIIGGYVHELLRAHAFRTRYTYVNAWRACFSRSDAKVRRVHAFRTRYVYTYIACLF